MESLESGAAVAGDGFTVTTYRPEGFDDVETTKSTWHVVPFKDRVFRNLATPENLDVVRKALAEGRQVEVVSKAHVLKGTRGPAVPTLTIKEVRLQTFFPGTVVVMPIVVYGPGNTTSLFLKRGFCQLHPRDMYAADGGVKEEEDAARDFSQKLLGQEGEIAELHLRVDVDERQFLPDRVNELAICVCSFDLSDGSEGPAALQDRTFIDLNINAYLDPSKYDTIDARVTHLLHHHSEIVPRTDENRAILRELFRYLVRPPQPFFTTRMRVSLSAIGVLGLAMLVKYGFPLMFAKK